MKAKMPSDPLEAEILALAGAVANDGDPTDNIDSDDSLPEDNLDLDAMHHQDSHHQPQRRFTEDIENCMAGSNIVPKPLPQVTPDSLAAAAAAGSGGGGAGHHTMQSYAANRNHHQRTAIKRRHSGK